jgi:hypothetical protein
MMRLYDGGTLAGGPGGLGLTDVAKITTHTPATIGACIGLQAAWPATSPCLFMNADQDGLNLAGISVVD